MYKLCQQQLTNMRMHLTNTQELHAKTGDSILPRISSRNITPGSTKPQTGSAKNKGFEPTHDLNHTESKQTDHADFMATRDAVVFPRTTLVNSGDDGHRNNPKSNINRFH